MMALDIFDYQALLEELSEYGQRPARADYIRISACGGNPTIFPARDGVVLNYTEYLDELGRNDSNVIPIGRAKSTVKKDRKAILRLFKEGEEK
jgi:hypothetical protein